LTPNGLSTHAVLRQSSALAAPADKVIPGRKYKVDDWLAEAYAALCKRPESLTLNEGNRMTMDDVIKISETHQSIRSSTVTATADEILLIVKRFVDVPQPHEGCAKGRVLLYTYLTPAVEEPTEPVNGVTKAEGESDSHDGPPEEPMDTVQIFKLVNLLVEK
jgi:hypothetical protein